VKFDPANVPLPAAEVGALCEPIMDPFTPGRGVLLKDRDGRGDAVTVGFEDTVTLRHEDGRLTLSRLGLINTLLDQAAPGLRLVAHVPGPNDPADGPCGLSLQRTP